MILDGPRFGGRVPCLLCRHARRPKSRDEWERLCGACRGLAPDEIDFLHWHQESGPDRVVIPPNMLRLSRHNSAARYRAAVHALRECGLSAEARVLDLGCGISAHAALLRPWAYVGADLNGVRVGYGAARHPWACFVVQDAARLGFRARTFDAAVCLDVVEHVPPRDVGAVLAELFRVLQPGGLLALSTPDGRLTFWKRIFGATCERAHHRELPPEEVEGLLRSAGGRCLLRRPIDNFLQPGTRLAGVLAHLVADRPSVRTALGRRWAAAGYRTVLYLAARV
jgi:SAM-dependent methyltransferase